MKKLLTLACAACLALMAGAVPAKPGTHTVAQSDGSTLTLRMVGDEWHHSYVTTDGLSVAQAPDGNFYYRLAGGLTTMLAHNPSDRPASEQTFVAQHAQNLTLQATRPAAASQKAKRNDRRRRATQVPNNGSPRIPIILVNYTDVKMKSDDPVAAFTAQFKEGGKSCFQYFYDQSRGKFTPQFDIYGPINLSRERAYYGGNDYYGDDKGVGLMVAEACDSLKATVDFSPYDNDGDGEVDVVIALYAGVGEAQAYRTVPSSVWPCQWELSDSEYGSKLQVGNKYIDKFAVFNELYGANERTTRLDGIGTFCHEFSHCLGLPDFYDTDYSGNFGMGDWSLLDGGCYNDDGDTPIGYSAYERDFMGWITLETPVQNTTYTLDALNTDTGKAYKIVNSLNPNEYYVLENRQRTGWDAYMAASGMLITHVDYDEYIWDINEVNNTGSHQRMTPIPADGVLSTYSTSGDLWPYNGLDSLTNNSSPAARVFTGTYMNQPIHAITRTGNQISFTYMPASYLRGDVNNDGEVDVNDVNILINIVLGNDEAGKYGDRANVDGSGDVDVADVNTLINLILSE